MVDQSNGLGGRRRALGDRGEAAAAAWYGAAGYEVVDRNWRSREGEIDLVVQRPSASGGRVLVFCEVKTRRSVAFGVPLEAITREKRRRLRVLAAKWLDEHRAEVHRAEVHRAEVHRAEVHPASEHRGVVREIRFDVASVTIDGAGALVVDVLEGAF